MFFRRKRKDEGAEAPGAEQVAPAPKSDGEAPSGGTTTQFLTGEAGKDRRNVQVLLEAIAQVSEARDLEALLIDIVDRSISVTGAERGLLLLSDTESPGSDRLIVRVARLRGGKGLDEEPRFSTSIATKVLTEVQALRATVHSESEALELGRSVYDLKLRAAMCVPLAKPEAYQGDISAPPLGVLYVDSRAATRQFSQEDLSLFAALAQHISIALENTRLHVDSLEKVRLEQSLELASTIQRDLMPKVPDDLPGWELEGWYRPAERTAGDFYDFVRLKDGKLAIAVGDVTGHGIGPALITASAQAAMRSYLRMLSDPGEVVTMLNQDLCERVQDGRFLTLFLGILSPDGALQGLNAGHTPPIVWRAATKEVNTLSSDGPALGMIPDETFTAPEPERLEKGDVLLVITDGLSEARSPDDHDKMLGDDGVCRVLAEHAERGESPREIGTALVEEAMRLSGGTREDDVTLVVVRRTS